MTLTYFKADPKRRFYPGQIVDFMRLPYKQTFQVDFPPCKCMLLSMHRNGRVEQWYHRTETKHIRCYYVDIRLLFDGKIIKLTLLDRDIGAYLSVLPNNS